MLIKRGSWLIGAMLIGASVSWAASITTSTTCSFPGAATVSDPVSCSLNTIDGRPFHEEASVAASVSVSGSSAIINVGSQAQINAGVGGSAEAVASIDLILNIAGPPRSGYVTFVGSQSMCANSTISVSLPVAIGADVCNLVPIMDYTAATTIGGVFPVSLFARSAVGGPVVSPSSGLLRLYLSFYNQDATPVEVTDVTPEPSTAALCLIPLLVIACCFVTEQGRYANHRTMSYRRLIRCN